MADSITSNDNEKWRTKRSSTYVTFMTQSFEIGLSTSVIATILWEYLKTVPCDNKNIFYGLIASIYNITPIIFSVVISRWIDRTRNVKQFMILANILSAIGHILFSLPFSPYLLIVGRFFDGVMITLKPIMRAETVRSYPRDVINNRLPQFTFFTMVGFAVGPLLTLAFMDVDVTFWNVHLSWGNCCGLMLFVFNIVQVLIILMFGHNLSKEYDLKKANEDENEKRITSDMENGSNVNKKSCDDIERSNIESKDGDSPSATQSKKNVLFKMLSKVDVVSLVFVSCATELWVTTFYRLVPVIILDAIHFTKTSLSIFYTAYSLIFMFAILVITKIKMKDRAIFLIGFSGFISLLIVCLCCMFISYKLSFITNAVLLSLFCLAFVITELSETVFIVIVYNKMITSENQGFAEGVRVSIKRVGTLLGATLAVYIYEYFKYSSFVLIVTVGLIFCFLFSRRNSLSNPKPVI